MVSGILLLVGKIAFLAALYGFLFAVYRGLIAEARRGNAAQKAEAETTGPPVERTVLRPSAAGPAMLRPPVVAAALAPPVLVSEIPEATPPVAMPSPVTVDGDELSVEPPASLPVPALLAQPAASPEAAVPSRPAGPSVVVLSSPGTGLANGQRFELGEVTRVGRADDNHITLEDRFVSAHHIELARKAGRVVIRDLGSTNGTFRNGARVLRETPLDDGDRLGVGTTMFIFHDAR